MHNSNHVSSYIDWIILEQNQVDMKNFPDFFFKLLHLMAALEMSKSSCTNSDIKTVKLSKTFRKMFEHFKYFLFLKRVPFEIIDPV